MCNINGFWIHTIFEEFFIFFFLFSFNSLIFFIRS